MATQSNNFIFVCSEPDASVKVIKIENGCTIEKYSVDFTSPAGYTVTGLNNTKTLSTEDFQHIHNFMKFHLSNENTIGASSILVVC